MTHLLQPSSSDVAVSVAVKPEDALSSIHRGKGIFVLQEEFNSAKLDHMGCLKLVEFMLAYLTADDGFQNFGVTHLGR